MDGYEVCSRLQEDPQNAYIPVVFATALGEERDKARAFAVGAADYLVKPFQKDALLDKVATHLKTGTEWGEISKADATRKPAPKQGQDFNTFKKFLIEQESLNKADASSLGNILPQDLYAVCTKIGIRSSIIAQHVAEFMRLPYIAQINPKDVLLGVLPTRFCRTNNVVSMADVGSDVAFVLANPFDWQLQDVFTRYADQGSTYRIVITEPENIQWLFEVADATSKGGEDMEGALAMVGNKQAAAKGGDLSDAIEEAKDLAVSAQQAPIIKLANALISKAIHSNASDVHIEPRENSLGVRYRIDGMLHESDPVPKNLQAPLISRLKIRSDMNIAERRLPQDGRIRINFQGRNIDLRVSSLPSRHGEKIVMRVLDGSGVSLDFDSLGFEQASMDAFGAAIKKPHGIVLVTGPTGSGKSTTLYTALQALNEPNRNIVTVEDPVEYEMHRITQVQVNPEIGLTFPSALRSILRQDPDVIMLGEIRDKDTMEIAVRAALTGHLVLSTLHTNDAAGTITRLVDMGMEPFMVSSALELAMAQRLLRKLCTHCKKAFEPAKDPFKMYGVEEQEGMRFYQPVGCDRCSGTGYKGRVAAVEVLSMDEDLKRMITERKGAEDIRDYAFGLKGMKTLRQSAFLKATQGQTSIEEVMRVTG
jgi:type II secretory ATPase GspE/PulE/Tfp pilus assembly ATPase PilB-like protein